MAPRTATRLSDYVHAVWVDCAGYQVSSSHGTSTLGDLLDDAVSQMETIQGYSVPSQAVASLMDVDSVVEGGGLWRPSHFLKCSGRIDDSYQVYDSVLRQPLIPVVEGCKVPFTVFPTHLDNHALGTRPLSWWATNYNYGLRWLTTSALRKKIGAVVSQWPRSPNVSRSDPMLAPRYLPPFVNHDYLRWLIDADDGSTGGNSDHPPCDNKLHAYATIRFLVALALRFPSVASCEENLHPAIVSSDDPAVPIAPSIGLTKYNVGKRRSYWEESLKHGDILTIWFPSEDLRLRKTATSGQPDPGYWLEVAKIDRGGQQLPEYEVIGAWAPTTCAPLHCMGGVVSQRNDSGKWNAFIV